MDVLYVMIGSTCKVHGGMKLTSFVYTSIYIAVETAELCHVISFVGTCAPYQ